MFATPDLAARIDRAEGRLCASIAHVVGRQDSQAHGRVFDVAGGLAVFAGADSPTNKMIGIGFAQSPTDDELSDVEAHFAAHRSPLQAEVSSLADPAVHAQLIARGYLASGFENVLGHPLLTDAADLPQGITINIVTGEARDASIEVAVTAFAHPDVGGVGGDALPSSDTLRAWMRLTMEAEGFLCIEARWHGELAGYAALRLDEGIAQLCGAGTLPAFRRRGIQTALLRWRLAHARRAGCDVAVVTTQPASKSQQNVQREGFSLLYVRQLLVKRD